MRIMNSNFPAISTTAALRLLGFCGALLPATLSADQSISAETAAQLNAARNETLHGAVQQRKSSIEALMRAYQERYIGSIGGVAMTWPTAGDGTPTPAFPPDGFYAEHGSEATLPSKYEEVAATMLASNRLSSMMSQFVNDPQWFDGRTTAGSGPAPTLSTTSGGSAFTNAVSASSAMEKIEAVRQKMAQMKHVGIFAPIVVNQALRSGSAESSYRTSDPDRATAWALAQNIMPQGDPISWGVSGGTSQTGTGVWLASQVEVKLTSSLPAGYYWQSGDMRVFLKIREIFLGGGLQGFPALQTNTYVQITGGGTTRMKVKVPDDFLTAEGSSFAAVNFGDPSPVLTPVMNHPADVDSEPKLECDEGAALSSAHYSWSAGGTRFGEMEGRIQLRHEKADGGWYTPDSLVTPVYHGFASIRDSAKHLLQVHGPDQVVDVANVTALGYQMKFYHREAAWTTGSDGRVEVPGTATPHLVAAVENPDATGATFNQLRITETRGTAVKWSLFAYDQAQAKWTMTSSEEAETETLAEASPDVNGVWTEDRVLTAANGDIVSRTLTTWKNLPWGRERLSEVEDPAGLARTTTWQYYTNQAAPPTGDGYQNYGQIKQVTHPNGSWEKYSYDSLRRIKKIVSTYQSSPDTAPESQCRVIEYTYPSQFTPATDYTMTVEKVLDVEVARKYRRQYWDGVDDIVCVTQGAAVNAADNLVTKTRYYLGGIFAGRMKSATRPDGTMSIYSYSANAAALDDATELTTTVSDGQPNGAGTAIIDGTTTVTKTNRQGYVVYTQSTDIAGGHVIAHAEAAVVDDFGRPTTVTDMLTGLSEITAYNCCEVESLTDKRGIQTSYVNSPGVKRRMSLGLTWRDKTEGRAQIQTRTGTDNVEMELSRQERNIAGELVSTASPASGTTTRSLAYTATEAITTITYPDTGTEVRTACLDGQLKSITGTAVFPKRYDYGVNTDGTRWVQEIALDAAGVDTAEWTKTTTDLAGRVIQADGSDGATATRHYNVKNQLVKTVDPDGVTMLYAYDDRGRLLRSAVDMDRDGVIDLGGTDRVTETTSAITTRDAGRVVNRATAKVWTTDNDANATQIITTTDAAVDGLDAWSTAGEVLTHVQTTYAGGGDWTVTTTYGEGSTATSTYLDGRLASTARMANDNSIIQSTAYAYDERGRVRQAVDGRGGVTDITYDAGDRVWTVTGPDPGDGNPRPVSTFGYDAAGRQNLVADVAGGTSTTLFNPDGTVQSTGGTRAYPLSYEYTPQGRL